MEIKTNQILNLNRFRDNKQWIVIGTEVDGRLNTFDCIPYNAINGISMPVTGKDGKYNYAVSYIREWLNSEFIKTYLGESFMPGGEDEDALVPMGVECNGAVFIDRVKLLSYTEICGWLDHTIKEPVHDKTLSYDYFNKPYRRILHDSNCNSVWWWTRSCTSSGKPIMVNPSGYVTDFGNNIAHIIPCIRVNQDHINKLHELQDYEKDIIAYDFY